MNCYRRWSLLVLLALTVGIENHPSYADEGMYLFNDLPVELFKERHGFDANQKWADQLWLSSVRFNCGGSGAFTSSTGFELTNHHVASETLHKLSSAEASVSGVGMSESLRSIHNAKQLPVKSVSKSSAFTDRL